MAFINLAFYFLGIIIGTGLTVVFYKRKQYGEIFIIDDSEDIPEVYIHVNNANAIQKNKKVWLKVVDRTQK